MYYNCPDMSCQWRGNTGCLLSTCYKRPNTYVSSGTILNKDYIQCPHCGQMIEKK